MPTPDAHAMQHGETLSDLVDRHHLEQWPTAADRTLCLNGLLHRWQDVCRAFLKRTRSSREASRDDCFCAPALVVLGEQGETLVDFSRTSQQFVQQVVAERKSESDDAEAQALDMLPYVCPEALEEQSATDEEHPRRLVYSLGAMLYYILSGRPPFTHRRLAELAAKIRSRDFLPPRSFNRAAPAPLEAVCLKAMAADSAERYASPEELLLDVRRWLADQPVSATPATLRSAALRIARQRPGATLALMAALLLLSAFLAVLAYSLNRERREADRTKVQAVQKRSQAVLAELRAYDKLSQLREQLYYSHIRRAQRETELGDRSAALEFLGQCFADLRQWEHHYLFTALETTPESAAPQAPLAAVRAEHPLLDISVDAAGKFAYLAAPDGAVERWSLADGVREQRYPPDSPDEPQLPDAAPPAVALHPDGAVLAVADNRGGVSIWDVVQATLLTQTQAGQGRIVSLQFSGDGRLLLGGADDGQLTLWRTGDFESQWSLEAHLGPCVVSLSYDGLLAASGGEDGVVKIWHADIGQKKLELTGHLGAVRDLTFSPDSEWLYSAGAGGCVDAWDAQTGHQRFRLVSQCGPVRAIAVTANGRRLASAGEQGDIELWNLLDGERVVTLPGQTGAVESLRFTQGDGLLVGGGADGVLRVWDATRRMRDRP